MLNLTFRPNIFEKRIAFFKDNAYLCIVKRNNITNNQPPPARGIQAGKNKMKNFKKIAEENNLSVVELCNGKEALIHFESFEQAESIANAYGLDTVHLKKRDGESWKVYSYMPLGPIEVSAFELGDDFEEWTSVEDFFENEIRAFLPDSLHDGEYDFKTFVEKTEEWKEIYDNLLKLKEGEIVLTYENRYLDTVKKEATYFEDYFNSRYEAIGVIAMDD